MPTLWSGSGSYDDKFMRHGHDCQSSQDSWQDGLIRRLFDQTLVSFMSYGTFFHLAWF